MKPTYGRVSRYGLVAFASSLDQIGPITKDARDAAGLLHIIAGHDRRDSTSIDAPVPDYPAELTGDVKGLRVGIPKEYMIEGLNAEVRATVESAAGFFEEQLQVAGIEGAGRGGEDLDRLEAERGGFGAARGEVVPEDERTAARLRDQR